MVQRFIISVAFFAVLLVSGCGDDRTITDYSLKKVDPETSYGHKWLPLNPTTYNVGENKVVSKTAGFLTEYHNCTILSLKDWECSYSDGSGKFGFRNGEYWELPVWSDVKHVSKLEYNLVRCDWAINDEHEGYFWGAIRCIVGWD
jgi:hypothetical protein